MKISLTDDTGFEEIKQFIKSTSRKTRKQAIDNKIKDLENLLGGAINKCVSEYENEEIYFKKDVCSSGFYLEFKNKPDNFDWALFEKLSISYIINVDFYSGSINFCIKQKELEISLTDIICEEDQQELEDLKPKKKDVEITVAGIIKLLTEHKETVLKVDYILRNFARENSFIYETNHNYHLKEDKRQRKFEYITS